MRLFEGVGLLRPAARVLACARDALLDRVDALADVVGNVLEIKRGCDRADLLSEKEPVALHLGDAILELSACAQHRPHFVQRLQRLLDRAERGLALGLAKPRPRARLAPGREASRRPLPWRF